jgi:two-component system, NtrC family, response regulator AtoC
MNITGKDVLSCVAQCAGDQILLALSNEGAVVVASSGAELLSSGILRWGETKINLGAKAWTPMPLELLNGPQDVPVSCFIPGQKQLDFRLYSYPIPEEKPEVLLLRLDPLEVKLSDRHGLPVVDPQSIPNAQCFYGMWTRSDAMKDMFRTLEQVAKSDATVLVRGESGTGKEHVANALHLFSKRQKHSFIAVNCAALMPSLLESELFGHVKGAFTGAVRARPGLFEQANKGSIFLDEIAEMPLELQSKLLRVLQDQKITPVGGTQSRTVDVRIISATHRSLRRAVAQGRFRDDLMYRLRVVPIFIPALRERRGDIELLLSVFIQEQMKMGRRGFVRIAPAAMRAMLDYPWPGNVRELRNVVEYATVVSQDEVLTLKDLPPEFRESDPRFPIQSMKPDQADQESLHGEPAESRMPSHSRLESPEAARLRAVLLQFNGHKGKAAKHLGMHRTTLWRKIKQYNLS